jgi:hypothetical protein
MTSKTTTSQYFDKHINLFLFKDDKNINCFVTLFENVGLYLPDTILYIL